VYRDSVVDLVASDGSQGVAGEVGRRNGTGHSKHPDDVRPIRPKPFGAQCRGEHAVTRVHLDGRALTDESGNEPVHDFSGDIRVHRIDLCEQLARLVHSARRPTGDAATSIVVEHDNFVGEL
jgi:hypothetical protein